MGVRGWGPDTFPSDAMPTERHYQLFLHSPRALAVPNPTDDLPYGTAGMGGGGGGRGPPWGPRPRGGGGVEGSACLGGGSARSMSSLPGPLTLPHEHPRVWVEGRGHPTTQRTKPPDPTAER